MEVTLDEFAEFFAVCIVHVHEFDAAAVRADIADDGGEIDFAEAGVDFKLDRVADAELPGGFQIGAAQADGLYPSKTCACAGSSRGGCLGFAIIAIAGGRMQESWPTTSFPGDTNG